MEENTETYPSLPSNYITIVDLQKQWMIKQQQHKQKVKEEEEKSRKDKEELNRKLSNKNDGKFGIKRESPFQKLERSNYDTIANPNFKNRKPICGYFDAEKPLNEFQGVEKAAEIDVVVSATVEDEKTKKKRKKKQKTKKKKKKNLEGEEREKQGKVKWLGDNQTAEIESKLKDVKIEGPNEVYGSHRRVEQRGFRGENWGFKIEKKNPTAAIEGGGRVSKVNRIYENRGGWRNGRSMAAMGGHRGTYNYMGGRTTTRVWVKKTEVES